MSGLFVAKGMQLSLLETGESVIKCMCTKFLPKKSSTQLCAQGIELCTTNRFKKNLREWKKQWGPDAVSGVLLRFTAEATCAASDLCQLWNSGELRWDDELRLKDKH